MNIQKSTKVLTMQIDELVCENDQIRNELNEEKSKQSEIIK